MQKSLLVLLCLIISIATMGQKESKRYREVGFITNSFSSYGLSYKIGKENSMWRFSSLLATGNNSIRGGDGYTEKRNSFQSSLDLGRELRKPIDEKFDFRYGLDLSFGYYQSASSRNDTTQNDNDYDTKTTDYSAGLKLVLGVNYKLSERLLLGFEVLPSVTYSYNINTIKSFDQSVLVRESESHDSSINYRLSSGIRFSLSYRL